LLSRSCLVFLHQTQVYLVFLRGKAHTRKTSFDLLAVHDGVWTCVDARVPNMLVEEALERHLLEGFEGYRVMGRDHHVGTSRIDLLLAEPPYLLEVKSCTLVRHGIAMFPDAPTTRGARHVEELTRGDALTVLQEGHRQL